MAEFYDFSGQNLDDAIDPQAVPEGEYTVQIADWKANDAQEIILEDKNGNPYVMPLLDVVDCEEAAYAKRFSFFMSLPHSEMDAKDLNACKARLKNFFTAFGVDASGRVDFESMLDLKADALLIVREDTGYGEQNAVKSWVKPR
jgi:hypothetical protein